MQIKRYQVYHQSKKKGEINSVFIGGLLLKEVKMKKIIILVLMLHSNMQADFGIELAGLFTFMKEYFQTNEETEKKPESSPSSNFSTYKDITKTLQQQGVPVYIEDKEVKKEEKQKKWKLFKSLFK